MHLTEKFGLCVMISRMCNITKDVRPELMMSSRLCVVLGNHTGMLIGRPIAIMYFLARKITAEDTEDRESD